MVILQAVHLYNGIFFNISCPKHSIKLKKKLVGEYFV